MVGILLIILFLNSAGLGTGQDFSLPNLRANEKNLSDGIGESLDKLDKGSENMIQINDNLQNYQDSLNGLKESYNQLGEDLDNKINQLNNLNSEIDKSNEDYIELKKQLGNLKEIAEKKEAEETKIKKDGNFFILNLIVLIINILIGFYVIFVHR